MSIVLLLLVLVIANGAKFVTNDGIHENYLDKKQTTTINGIFVFLVIMSHARQYIELSGPYNDSYIFLSNFLNQAIVVTFLFYSGYGIMEGIKKKGPSYVKTIPSKLLKLFIQFDIAILLFLITNWLTGNFPSFKNILLALTSWGSIGNSNWYITAILLLYLFTFLSFRFLNNHWISLIILAVLTMGMVYFYMVIDRPAYTYNTMICYVFGVFYSLIHEHIRKYLGKPLIYLSLLLVTLGVTVYARPFIYQNIKFYSIWMIGFMFFILLFSMKVELNSPLLNFLGQHVFSIYILQRIPMIILKHLGYSNHMFTFFTISLVTTFILAIIFDKYVMDFINRLVKPRTQKG